MGVHIWFVFTGFRTNPEGPFGVLVLAWNLLKSAICHLGFLLRVREDGSAIAEGYVVSLRDRGYLVTFAESKSPLHRVRDIVPRSR